MALHASADTDYVVITTEDYDDAFQNLTHWKETRGLYTERTNLTTHIELLSNITSNSSFWEGGYHDISTDNSTLSQIRNYINYTHFNLSTSYILLGANSSIIPTKVLPVGSGGRNASYDLWYANISGSPNDYEVYIGRIPCNSTTQIDNWTARLEIYENCTNETWATSMIKTAANGISEYATAAQVQNLTTHYYYTRDKDEYVIFTENQTSQFFTFAGHGCTTGEYSKMKCSLFPNEMFKEKGYENLTYPYINLATGCSQAQMVTSEPFYHTKFHELLFGGPNLDSNRTAIAHIGYDCASLVTPNDPYRTELIIEASLVETSPHIGTSLGKAFQSIEGGSLGTGPYAFSGLNLFGCPETKPYVYNYNISAEIDTRVDPGALDATAWIYGPEEVYYNYYIHTLSYWLYNKTIIGTANGDNFSNYTLQLGWWDSYNFTFANFFYDAWDINPNSTLFDPPNKRYCFDIPDPNSPVTDGPLGTLNTSSIEYLPKGVYQIKLIVNSTNGKSISKCMYFTGPGYVEGIVTQSGVEVPINTPLNITYLLANLSDPQSSLSYTNTTVLTKNVGGHTGYYNFSLWSVDIKPMQRRNPKIISTIYVSCENSTAYDNFFLSEDPTESIPTQFITINLNLDLYAINETPRDNSVNNTLSLNLSINISAFSGSFDWSIECNNSQTNSANDDTNGTKTCILTNLNYNTTYTWYVNVTDGTSTLNRTFSFATKTTVAETVCVVYTTDTFNATPYANSMFYIVGVFMILSCIMGMIVIVIKYT